MRLLAALGFTLALAGWADSHNWAPQQNGSARLGANDRIFISTPMDGEYGNQAYKGSGRNTASLYNATNGKSRWVQIGGEAENFEDAVSQAQRTDQDILFFSDDPALGRPSHRVVYDPGQSRNQSGCGNCANR